MSKRLDFSGLSPCQTWKPTVFQRRFASAFLCKKLPFPDPFPLPRDAHFVLIPLAGISRDSKLADARFGLGTASLPRVLARHRSGVRFLSTRYSSIALSETCF